MHNRRHSIDNKTILNHDKSIKKIPEYLIESLQTRAEACHRYFRSWKRQGRFVKRFEFAYRDAIVTGYTG
jgi:hypothetical protein